MELLLGFGYMSMCCCISSRKMCLNISIGDDITCFCKGSRSFGFFASQASYCCRSSFKFLPTWKINVTSVRALSLYMLHAKGIVALRSLSLICSSNPIRII